MKLKPRSDSVIESLPAEQRKQIDDWLFKDNVSYHAAAKLAEKLGLKIPHHNFYRYYQRQAAQCLVDRIAASAEKASALFGQFKDPKFCEALGLVTGQLAFEEALKTASDPAEQNSPREGESKPENKVGRAPRRDAGKYGALVEAANLYFKSAKLNLAKRGDALDRKKFALDAQKLKRQDAQRKEKSGSNLATGKRKGGISEQTLREIEEGAHLL